MDRAGGRASLHVVCLLLALAATCATTGGTMFAPNGFVRVHKNSFVDNDCLEFIPIGWNTWGDPLLDYAVQIVRGDTTYSDKLHDLFSEAQQNNFNTMRVFGIGLPWEYTLQIDAGVYNEEVFRAFDIVLAIAAEYDVKIIWAFTTHWQENDGPEAYLKWCNLCGEDGTCELTDYEQFWTNSCTKDLFKKHITQVTERINTVTNRAYKDDPVFFAWNLYNEPRCPANQTGNYNNYCIGAIASWAAEMAEHTKSVDPNHLVTFGQEGFFANGSLWAESNPDGVPGNVNEGWTGFTGQNFFTHHYSEYIDFGAFHMWPDNWDSASDTSWVAQWITAHIEVGRSLQKPIVLEEFGKRAWNTPEEEELRNEFYSIVYRLAEESAKYDGWFKGNMFWNWDHWGTISIGPNETDFNGASVLPSSANAIKSDSTTLKLIQAHALEMQTYNGREKITQGCQLIDSTNFVNFIPMG